MDLMIFIIVLKLFSSYSLRPNIMSLLLMIARRFWACPYRRHRRCTATATVATVVATAVDVVAAVAVLAPLSPSNCGAENKMMEWMKVTFSAMFRAHFKCSTEPARPCHIPEVKDESLQRLQAMSPAKLIG